MREGLIELDGGIQLVDRDVFFVGMRHMDGSWAGEQRRSPIREQRHVGGVRKYRRIEPWDGVEPDGRNIEHLLTRPVGRPSHKPKVFSHSFRYQPGSWDQPRRVVAKVEWHRGELFPRVGFIVTNLSWRSKNVVKFYNGRGTAEQWIKEGKHAVKWTKLSCRTFRDNQARLQLFALAYNLGNFLRRLALPKPVRHWSLTTLREKLIKIGAKVTRHAKYVAFQLAEVAVTRNLFAAILDRIARLALPPRLVMDGA